MRGWVFCAAGTMNVIGEADEFEYLNAREAVEDSDLPELFDLYFRTSDGVLHPVADNSEPIDFDDPEIDE